MQERTLRVLEFTKIREMLKGLAVSTLGAEKCAALSPSCDPAQVHLWQQETEEALILLTYLPHHPLIPFSDVTPWLRLAAAGATLTPKALLEIAESMRAARAARDALVTEREDTPRLTALASELSTFRRVEEEITGAILSEDEIADRASSDLADIRRRIRSCNERVREKLNAMIHSPSLQKYLSDAVVTVRNDRYVIPVKAEARANVPGLVHDQSSSGATLFIEPMAVVEIGNDLKQLQAKEKAEIERILRALSARITPEVRSLQNNLDVLAELDFRFAKARLSRQMHAVEPKINGEGRIRIVRGRHPLIAPEKVVPTDLWLGDAFTTLVITGPNTGGKTVTLKTVGLFTLMAAAGLQVPADLGTELSVFENVFADIGDEQSIEQSLSTFSSHMVNIVSIMGAVTEKSLALFDELGAGTDPTEGAALAQAILSTLLAQGVRTLATTHYAELKAFALTTPGVENACVEFDVETLRPTYKLLIGVPGKSNAFEISRRLGLSDEVIEQARKMLSREQVRFEDVIANAEYHRQVAERERKLAEEARREMVAAREAAQREQEKLAAARETAMKKAREDARRIVERAREESESVIADLRRMKKDASGVREHELQAARRRMEQTAEGLAESLKAPAETPLAPPKDLKAGESVKILHLGTKGTVLAPADARGEVQVQAGILKLKVHVSQLQRERTEQKPMARVHSDVDMATRQVGLECDLRGLSLEEAIDTADKYLDDALLCGLHEVFLIHGKGTGTLRAGVQEYLRKHPRVKSFRAGRYGEGEDGVTVVTLK